MSALEQRTNHALRILDSDLRAGRTTIDGYRRQRRALLQHLRGSLDATLDITLRRSVAVSANHTHATPRHRPRPGRSLRPWAVLAWIAALVLLAGSAWFLLPLATGE